jgi:small subunit ribosomal protein S20
MANIKSQKKRNRQNEEHRLRNRNVRGITRSALKNARQAIEAGDENAEVLVAAAIKALDKAAQKGVIHKNNIARHKSRLMHKLADAKNAQ